MELPERLKHYRYVQRRSVGITCMPVTLAMRKTFLETQYLVCSAIVQMSLQYFVLKIGLDSFPSPMFMRFWDLKNAAVLNNRQSPFLLNNGYDAWPQAFEGVGNDVNHENKRNEVTTAWFLTGEYMLTICWRIGRMRMIYGGGNRLNFHRLSVCCSMFLIGVFL